MFSGSSIDSVSEICVEHCAARIVPFRVRRDPCGPGLEYVASLEEEFPKEYKLEQNPFLLEIRISRGRREVLAPGFSSDLTLPNSSTSGPSIEDCSREHFDTHCFSVTSPLHHFRDDNFSRDDRWHALQCPAKPAASGWLAHIGALALSALGAAGTAGLCSN